MGQLTITFEVPDEIEVGLKAGKFLRKGGVIVDVANGQVKKWLNEATMAKISSAASLGFIPAMIGLTVVTAAGFLFMNSKLNKIQENLLEIKSDLAEIKAILSAVKETISNTQEYEIGKLFADFKTNLQEAKFCVLENKAENLLNLRREFIKISNRVCTLLEMIERKGKIILMREVYLQYLELYHACIECAVRCSMAGREFTVARNLITESAQKFTEIQKNYQQAFINASANEVANISYAEIPKLQAEYFQIKFMSECVESNEQVINCMEQEKFTYFEFEGKMNELQNSDRPAMLIFK